MEKSNKTPIKVPGKNNRDQRRAVVKSRQNTGVKSPRQPGRPLKSTNPTSQPRDSSKDDKKPQRQRSLKNLKSKRSIAALERLPTELMLKVFLLAMNLDLPRASPIIAGKLSSQHTYVETIMSIFDPTWEHSYKLAMDDIPILGPVPGDPELQSSMLRCHCATLKMVRKAEEKWLHRLTNHGDLNHTLPSLDNDKTLWKWDLSTKRDLFLEDYRHFEVLSEEYRQDDKLFNLSPPWHWTAALKIHPDVDIPESLLMGPWTIEMMEYLFWLVRAGARISWMESTSGETATLGLKSAIISGSIKVLYIFHFLGLAEHVTIDLLIWALHNAGGDIVDVNTRLMSMFISRQHQKYASEYFLVTGELRKMKKLTKVHRKSLEPKDIEDLASLVILEDRWNTATQSI